MNLHAHSWKLALAPDGMGILVLPLTKFQTVMDLYNILTLEGLMPKVGAWACTRTGYDVHTPRLIDESIRHIVFFGAGHPHLPLNLVHTALSAKTGVHHSLISDLIMACTVEGETVLDPFAQLGTVAYEAIRMRRPIIAIESDGDYIATLKSRCYRAELEMSGAESTGEGTTKASANPRRRGPRKDGT